MRSEFTRARGPEERRRSLMSAAARFSALAMAGLLAGACAASKGASDYQSHAGAPPARVAAADPPKVELEADGLPAQLPPRRRVKTRPIDPSEPFSPNYGPPPVNQQFPTEPEPLRHADAVQPVRLRAGEAEAPQSRHLTPAEAEAIIARAVLEHEKRYP
jgi:hypothetical protein